MDEKVRDCMNVLNGLRYQTVQKQKRLEELQTSYDQMQKDASDAVATDSGDSEDSQVYCEILSYQSMHNITLFQSSCVH